MINLTEETAKIYGAQEVALGEVLVEFQTAQQGLIDSESEMRIAHEKQIQALGTKLNGELQKHIDGQEAAAKKLQEDAQKKDAEIRAETQAEIKALEVKYQEQLLAEVGKEQAAQKKAAATQSTEALLAEQMKGMTAQEISDEFKKTREIVPVAKYLGVAHSGNEITIAERIVEKLKES